MATSADGTLFSPPNSDVAGDAAESRDSPAAADEQAKFVDSGDERVVRLQIPAIARYLRLARLIASGMAADLGFGVDRLEDLRVAVDELCASIIDAAPDDAELSLSYRAVAGGLQIEGQCRALAQRPPSLHAVARELVDILADEYSIGEQDGTRNFRLVKRAAP